MSAFDSFYFKDVAESRLKKKKKNLHPTLTFSLSNKMWSNMQEEEVNTKTLS